MVEVGGARLPQASFHAAAAAAKRPSWGCTGEEDLVSSGGSGADSFGSGELILVLQTLSTDLC